MKEEKSILLFDGVCNLCNGFVQFILKRDQDEKILFASLQSEAGQALLKELGLPQDDFDSFVFYEGKEFFIKSTASLKVLKKMGGFWTLAYGLIIFPLPIRDWVYNWVARNRYRFLGKRQECMVPTPEIRKRFLL